MERRIYKISFNVSLLELAEAPVLLKDMEYINKHTGYEYNFLAVLDDVVTGVKLSKEILRMLCIGRYKGMSAIICVQGYYYITILNSSGRSNINFMLLGNLIQMIGLKR